MLTPVGTPNAVASSPALPRKAAAGEGFADFAQIALRQDADAAKPARDADRTRHEVKGEAQPEGDGASADASQTDDQATRSLQDDTLSEPGDDPRFRVSGNVAEAPEADDGWDQGQGGHFPSGARPDDAAPLGARGQHAGSDRDPSGSVRTDPEAQADVTFGPGRAGGPSEKVVTEGNVQDSALLRPAPHPLRRQAAQPAVQTSAPGAHVGLDGQAAGAPVDKRNGGVAQTAKLREAQAPDGVAITRTVATGTGPGRSADAASPATASGWPSAAQATGPMTDARSQPPRAHRDNQPRLDPATPDRRTPLAEEAVKNPGAQAKEAIADLRLQVRETQRGGLDRPTAPAASVAGAHASPAIPITQPPPTPAGIAEQAATLAPRGPGSSAAPRHGESDQPKGETRSGGTAPKNLAAGYVVQPVAARPSTAAAVAQGPLTFAESVPDPRRETEAAPGVQAGEARASATSPVQVAPPPTRTDAGAVLRQIAEAMARGSDPGIDIRLSPEELGRVRLQMVPGEHGMMVHVQADRPETLDLLRRHIDQLAKDLAASGHEAAGFTFAGGGSSNDASDRERRSAVGSVEAPATPPVANESKDNASAAERVAPGSIDIRL